MNKRSNFNAFIEAYPNSILIEIVEAKGSTPRELGAFMLVSHRETYGTIGGGRVEFLAIKNARALLMDKGVTLMDIPLGPEIGQCCGGFFTLRFTKMHKELQHNLDARLIEEVKHFPKLYIFGAGHVGRALAVAFAPLPINLTLVETREKQFENLFGGSEKIVSPIPESLVQNMPAGTAIIIVTHDHALDFLIAKEALARDDFAYIGMIGSATKRAKFSKWFLGEGGKQAWLERLTLPIGGGDILDKQPEVIAAMTVAETLSAFAKNRLKLKEYSQSKKCLGLYHLISP